MKPLQLVRSLLRKDTVPTLRPVSAWPYWPRILESFPGAWQSNVVVDQTLVAAYWAVYACVTLIAGDISKLRVRVMQEEANGHLKETLNRPVLYKPNHYQTHIQFFFQWVISLLLHGNTYVLKQRNAKGFIERMYVLCPQLVTPLVTPDGSVYYELRSDNLAGIEESRLLVPASEIIHDRMYPLYHPLVGVSPITACGTAAMQGLYIQDNSAKFFQNMSRPSGVLSAPGAISNDVATRLKVLWEENFTGSNIGRVAVLGDGLKYEAMTINAHDAQLIEQLKMSGEMVAACFHVPGYKIGVGQMPTVNNTAVLNQQYYDQCLQHPIENMELMLDEGLELEPPFYSQFDLGGLLRMDPVTRYDAHAKAINGSLKTPNEARMEENLPPVDGGGTVYMQSQNQSLAALDRRDKDAISGKTDVQDSAMNGGQVTALQALLQAGAQGQMPVESVKIAIAAAFPSLSEDEVAQMVAPLGTFKSKPPQESVDGGAAGGETDDSQEFDGLKLLELLREMPLEASQHA